MLYKNKYLKYKNKYLKYKNNLYGGGEDLNSTAEKYLGKLSYIIESKHFIYFSDELIRDNVVCNYFIVYYCLGDQYYSSEIYNLIYNMAKIKMEQNIINMNCFQFVLFCCIQINLLTIDDVKKLYNWHIKNKKATYKCLDTKDMQDEPVKDSESIVILSHDNKLTHIYHIGILKTDSTGPIEFYNMFNGMVELTKISDYTENSTCKYIDKTIFFNTIKKLPDITDKDGKLFKTINTYILLSLLFKNNDYFKKEFDIKVIEFEQVEKTELTKVIEKELLEEELLKLKKYILYEFLTIEEKNKILKILHYINNNIKYEKIIDKIDISILYISNSDILIKSIINELSNLNKNLIMREILLNNNISNEEIDELLNNEIFTFT